MPHKSRARKETGTNSATLRARLQPGGPMCDQDRAIVPVLHFLQPRSEARLF